MSKSPINYQIAFSVCIYQNPPLPLKKTVWGIDTRCGIHKTQIAAIRSQLPEFKNCSDEHIKLHYQSIYRKWKSWKVVKANSLPDLSTLIEKRE